MFEIIPFRCFAGKFLLLLGKVEGSACRALVAGPMPNNLEDILVLRVERGSDRYHRKHFREATKLE